MKQNDLVRPASPPPPDARKLGRGNRIRQILVEAGGRSRVPRPYILVALLVVVLVAGCSAPDDPTVLLTRDALSQSLAAGATVAPTEVLPTATATSAPPTATAPPPPTATVDPMIEGGPATATAESMAQATAAAVQPVLEELEALGIDTAQGQVAWIHPSTELVATDPMTYTYVNRNLLTLVEDFVLQSDVTWSTELDIAGCGFVVRSDGREEGLNQYAVVMTRAEFGNVAFSEMTDGQVSKGFDWWVGGIPEANFDWHKDATNRITIVGRGNTFEVYSNGFRLGEYRPELELDRGFVAFVALNGAGTTTCQFDNSWLWLIE